MAAMADFAQMPTRQRVMLFALVGAVFGIIYYQFGYKKLVEKLQTAQVDHDANVAANSKADKDIGAYAKLKTRMINLNRIIEENETALPTESELPAFFDMLNRKVLESGVEVVSVTQGAEVPVESFVKVPISYEIQGSFLQIKKFFASLIPKKKHSTDAPQGTDTQQQVDEKERIVSIENLSLTNPVVRNHEIKLTAKFIASTYRQEDAQPSATPAKPKAATPATPGTKTAPPTNTPAGAKAATEKALDKADTRSQKANGVDETSGSAKMKGGVP